MGAIFPYVSLGQWLDRNHGKHFGVNHLQQLRHQWVDQLIRDINQQIKDAE